MKKFSIISVLFILIFAFSCLDAGDMPEGRQNTNIPTVKATIPTNITYNGVTLTGDVESANGYKITERGFYFSTSNNPSEKNGTNIPIPISQTEDGIGAISAEIKELTAYTDYYYVAYAKNEKGTQYSNVITFRTWSEAPTVVTKEATIIADGSISVTGTIVSAGAAPVYESGICWSTTNKSPTIVDDFRRAPGDNSEGDFTIDLTEMSGSKTYYFRAYAFNDKGDSYGETVTLKAPLIWENLTAFSGQGRISAGTFTIGHSFYVTVGDGGSAPLKDTWEYYTYNSNWRPMADYPGVARKVPSSFVIGNKGYVGLGQSGSSTLSDFSYYVQSSNEWRNIESNFPGTARAYALSFSLNNKGYIVGGRIINGIFNYEYVSDIWQYSVSGSTGTWKRMNPFPIDVFGGVGFTVKNKAYIGLVAKHNKIWEYNEVSDSWSEIADAPEDLYTDNMDAGVTGVTVVGNIVYFIDGRNQIWGFDPSAKAWSKKSLMPAMQAPNQVMFSDGNDVYVGLNQYSSIFYKYRPLWDN